MGLWKSELENNGIFHRERGIWKWATYEDDSLKLIFFKDQTITLSFHINPLKTPKGEYMDIDFWVKKNGKFDVFRINGVINGHLHDDMCDFYGTIIWDILYENGSELFTEFLNEFPCEIRSEIVDEVLG